jgi:cytochrome bd ubiquinol oxidase subunit II
MIDMLTDLTVIWALLLALSVFIYVALDGFDLGIGILYPLFPQKKDRDLLMNAVAPVWDGNETWLVLGGGGLMAAFPLAYAVLLPALYPPIIIMLLALVFRGVAFEFRWRSGSRFTRRAWDASFFWGSLLASFMQGITLGALLQGIKVEGRAYAGGWWDWLTPFTLLTGVAVVCGYTLLGTCYLNWKLEGAIQTRVRHMARRLGLATLIFIVAVSLATPFLTGEYYLRWFTWPSMLVAAPVPILLALIALSFARSLFAKRRDWAPFALALAMFALCFMGLGLSMWPNVIPPSITIWDAASPRSSQVFMLWGAAIMLPIILSYTGYAYYVFRGKLDPDEGYH